VDVEFLRMDFFLMRVMVGGRERGGVGLGDAVKSIFYVRESF
jgi:hypothetical protein